MGRIERVAVGSPGGSPDVPSHPRRNVLAMPIGFALATGFTAVFVGTVAAAVAPRHHPVLRVAVLAAFVAAGAAVTASLAGAVGTATMGWPFVNGFLVNGLGDLVWRGVADLIRLAVSLAAALAGPAAGRGWQHRRAGRHEAWTDPRDTRSTRQRRQ